VAGSETALVATAFALVYRTARFIHFSQAATVAGGAYVAHMLHSTFKQPLPVAVCFAVVLCSLSGVIADLCVFRPLRKRHASGTILLLASLGLFIAVQNTISLCFGDSVVSLSGANVMLGMSVLGARLSHVRALIVGVNTVTVLTLALWLRFSRTGKCLRAVGSNPQLAEICGLRTDRVILIAFAVSSALAGLLGVLLSLDTGMRPLMGVSPLIAGIVAVIAAGEKGVWGIGGAALFIAALQQFVVWFFGAQWHEAATFSILLVVLVFRPTGLFARPASSN